MKHAPAVAATDVFRDRLLAAVQTLERVERRPISGLEIARRAGAEMGREPFSSGWFSQLMSSETSPPPATALAVAIVCRVDAGWLICGSGSAAPVEADERVLAGMREQLALYLAASAARAAPQPPAPRAKVTAKKTPPASRKKRA